MGNHSNKRPIVHKPKEVPVSFKPIVVTDGEITKGYAKVLPPEATPLVDDEFNLTQGNLGRVHRLVARRKLKDRVKLLETIIKTHQPLMDAIKVTQKAFHEGVMEGIRQVAAAEREKETKQAMQALQPEETPETIAPTTEDVATNILVP